MQICPAVFLYSLKERENSKIQSKRNALLHYSIATQGSYVALGTSKYEEYIETLK